MPRPAPAAAPTAVPTAAPTAAPTFDATPTVITTPGQPADDAGGVPPRGRVRRSGVVMIVGAAACWSTIGPALKTLPPDVGSLAVAAARTSLGGALFLTLSLLAGQAGLRALCRSRRDLRLAVVTGLAIGCYQPCYLYALAHAGVAIGSVVCMGTVPVFSGIIARLGPEGCPGRRWAVGSLAAVIGCTALTARDVTVTGGLPLGVLAALAGGAAWAVLAAASGRVVARGHCPTATMSVAFVAAATMLAPVFAVERFGWALDGAGALVVGYLGAVTTVGAYQLFSRGLRRTPTAVAGSLVLAEPLCASLIGIVWLGERLDPVQACGLGLLGLGLVVVAIGVRTPSDEARNRSEATCSPADGSPPDEVRDGTARPGRRRTIRWAPLRRPRSRSRSGWRRPSGATGRGPTDRPAGRTAASAAPASVSRAERRPAAEPDSGR